VSKYNIIQPNAEALSYSHALPPGQRLLGAPANLGAWGQTWANAFYFFKLLLAVTCGLGLPSMACASQLKWNAPELFDKSVTTHLQLAEGGGGIELETGELFEDDGPASGHSYQKPKNQEVVTKDVWIKKDLIIPNPQARSAFLVVLSEEPFEAIINGARPEFGASQSGRKLYKTYAFDPKTLKPGRNEIVLHGSGKVWIARDDEFALGSRTRTKHPNRSAKSTDAGNTWDYVHLGPDGKLDGEYGVRVYLDHYQSEGSLTMPVIDLGNLEAKPVSPPVTRTGPVEITVNGAAARGGRIIVRVRTGSTPVPTVRGWSGWRVLGKTGGILEKPTGRYAQIAVDFATSDPLHSPKVGSIRVEATPVRPEDWSSRLRVVEQHNEEIVRTSIPFEYEPLDQPQLRKLREQFKLDDVVKGAQTELELMLRLAQWACNYWDWPNHIMESYPAWNALEILKPHKDGTPCGGFCQQFNLVFLQACESFGISGRAISISQGRLQEKYEGGGHEIVELWSSEWKKWIYVDGALAWYIVDQKTGVPLSMLELRKRQLAALRGDPVEAVRVVEAVRTKNKQFTWSGLGPPKPLNWYLELRLIPRSNFLQEKSRCL